MKKQTNSPVTKSPKRVTAKGYDYIKIGGKLCYLGSGLKLQQYIKQRHNTVLFIRFKQCFYNYHNV